MNRFVAGFVGLLFGAGLVVGGMTDANKVIGFLDIFGDWDPTLAFVMGGAVVVNGIGMRLVGSRDAPLFADSFGIPTRKDIDARLIGGAALFGLGWGLGGYCPGPGLVSVTGMSAEAMVFVAMMILGMVAYHWTQTQGAEVASTPEASTPPTQGVQRTVAP